MTAPLDENAQAAPSAPLFEIATAPGDLPIAEIQARAALQERQFRHDNTITPPAPAPDTPVAVLATSGTRAPVARLKLAALCQFRLAATPIIYYGTEIGLTHAQG